MDKICGVFKKGTFDNLFDLIIDLMVEGKKQGLISLESKEYTERIKEYPLLVKAIELIKEGVTNEYYDFCMEFQVLKISRNKLLEKDLCEILLTKRLASYLREFKYEELQELSDKFCENETRDKITYNVMYEISEEKEINLSKDLYNLTRIASKHPLGFQEAIKKISSYRKDIAKCKFKAEITYQRMKFHYKIDKEGVSIYTKDIATKEDIKEIKGSIEFLKEVSKNRNNIVFVVGAYFNSKRYKSNAKGDEIKINRNAENENQFIEILKNSELNEMGDSSMILYIYNGEVKVESDVVLYMNK